MKDNQPVKAGQMQRLVRRPSHRCAHSQRAEHARRRAQMPKCGPDRFRHALALGGGRAEVKTIRLQRLFGEFLPLILFALGLPCY